MIRSRIVITASTICLALLAGVCQAQSASYQGGLHTRSLITQPVEENRLVTLSGNTRPEAIAQNDRGRVEDNLPLEHMLLQLQRPPEVERELVNLIDEMHRPGSPAFHQWMLPGELGERFGVSQPDIEKIVNWLESHGFKINTVFPTGMVVDFSGNAEQVREAFHTEIHNLEVDGTAHIANMRDPQIPAALAGAVKGVVSLHNFMPHPLYLPRPAYTFTSGTTTEYALVPPDLATIYNLNPLFTAGLSGAGQTVVVIEDTNLYSTGDWTTFRNTFGLSSFTSGSLTQVHPGGCTNPGVNGAEIEAALDAQWSSAAAPNAHIELASCADTGTTFGGLIALENLVSAGSPPAIMSISYGECEALNGATSNAAFSSAYQSAVAAGVSVFVASGDEGAASCDANAARATHGIGVSGFASTVYNVAVGGTDYSDTFSGTNSTYWNSTNTTTFGSAKSYIPETPWNDSCASVLISTFEGFSTTYGTSGFCNSAAGEANFLTTASGSGGPSGCATGTASTSGVVSGTCAGYPKPSWQSVLGNPADTVRDIPDVSLFAANGVWGHYYIFCDTNPSFGGTCTGAPSGWLGAGGTSFASPIMAGIMSLVNEKQGAAQGNPNPRLYALADTEYGTSGSTTCNSSNGNAVGSSCIFYDVTLGDIDVNCRGTHNCYIPSGTNGVLSTSNTAYDIAYGTTTGWDFASGIGTVNAYNLVFGWGSGGSPDFTISASPTAVSVAQGASGTSTITTAALNGFDSAIALTATGQPAGVTVSFNPSSIAAPGNGTSTMTMMVAATTATGTYPITVTGTGGGITHTTTVTLTVTAGAANFTISASPTAVSVAQGASGTSTITTTISGIFNSAIALTATGQPAGVTVSFNPSSIAAPGNGTSTMTMMVAATTATGTYPITVTGTGGGITHTTTVTLTVTAGAANFTISASPTAVSVAQGASGTSTITTTISGIFNSAIALTATGEPAGVTVSFNPSSIAAPGNGTSTMTMMVAATTATGTYPITVTGTGGGITHTTTVTLTVTAGAANFTISASPTSVSVAQGASGTSTITTTISGIFNSAIALTATGQPAGVTVTFNPSSIAAPGNGTSTMTMMVAATTATGTYPITVTGTGGGLTHTTTVTLTVTAGAADFTISAAPTAVSVAQGASGTSTITTTISGIFNSAIALTATGQPAGVTVTFNPSSIVAPGNGTSTMTMMVAATTATGTYPITVTGTGGGLTHTTTVTLTVTSGSVSTTTTLTTSPNPSNANSTVTMTATVTASNGVTPTGAVAFYSNGAVIGAVNMVAGVATFYYSGLPVGTESIVATYAGSGLYTTSTSNTVSQVVNGDATTTALTASTGGMSVPFGTPITFTATVTAATGTPSGGTVRFFNGSVLLGTATVNSSGVANFTTSKLPVGTDSITAGYLGFGNFGVSTSPPYVQVITPAGAKPGLAVTSTARPIE